MEKTSQAAGFTAPKSPWAKRRWALWALLFFLAHPASAALLSTSGAVPGYEHIRFDGLAFDVGRRELRFSLENTTPQDLQFSATLLFSNREGATVFRPRVREFLKGRQHTPCRIPLPSGKNPEFFRELVALRWEVAKKNRVVVEVRPVVSVARGDCGQGFAWQELRFFGSDYGYEVRGKVLCPRGKTPWSRGTFHLRLENVVHEALLEKDVVLRDLRPGTERDVLIRGTEITLGELRALTSYQLSLTALQP